MSKEKLESKKTFSQIQSQYEEDPSEGTVNILTYGKPGSGKTNSLRTARAPVVVHSFDPGGTTTIRDEIGDRIFVERFEQENAEDPTEFARWKKRFVELKQDGFFDEVGTYALDSLTNWSQALLNQVLKESGRTAQKPQFDEWSAYTRYFRQHIKLCCQLPCDFIAIGHVQADKDEITGARETEIAVQGRRIRSELPLLFDELYFADTKEKSSGINYYFLTRNNGRYQARSRLGLDKKIDQDYKTALHRAGFSASDKELPDLGDDD